MPLETIHQVVAGLLAEAERGRLDQAEAAVQLRAVLDQSAKLKRLLHHPSHRPLSPRENGILRAVAAGKSNKMVARDLGLQEVTVKAHLRSIFSKLGVASRGEAVRLAAAEGLLDEGAARP